MATIAYLNAEGWASHEHALRHSGSCITKSIAVAQQNNIISDGKIKQDAHADQWWARAFDERLKGIKTKINEGTGRTEGIHIGSGANDAGMRMRIRGLPEKDVGGIYGCFVRGEEPGGTFTPMKADVERNQSGGNESRDREGLGVPVVTKEKTKKSKKRNYMEVAIHDLEVRGMKALAKIQPKGVSCPAQGEQTVNTPPQIRDFTAVNHNQDMLFVKVWRGAEGERKEERRKEQKELVTWQLPSINAIQQRSQWVAALEVQKRRTRQIEKQRR